MDLETAQAIVKTNVAVGAGGPILDEIRRIARQDANLLDWCDKNLSSGFGGKPTNFYTVRDSISSALSRVWEEAERFIEQAKIARIEQEIAQPGPVIVTVPSEWATFGKKTAKAWAKIVTGIVTGNGARMYEGGFLTRGRKTELPIGTLFLCYDQSRGGGVDVTLHIAVPDDDGYGWEIVGRASSEDWAIDLKPTIRKWLSKVGRE